MNEMDIEFDIAGPILETQIDYKNHLDELIRELRCTNVRFIGYQNIEDQFFARYDFYLCTSKNESSPMAVWEAMASGLPIVSTPVGDLPELNNKFKFGWVSPSFSVSDIRAAIESAISCDRAEYDQYGKRAREVVDQHFSIDKVANQYIRFYSNLISESSG